VCAEGTMNGDPSKAQEGNQLRTSFRSGLRARERESRESAFLEWPPARSEKLVSFPSHSFSSARVARHEPHPKRGSCG
jgi:hypothetical protein